MKVSLYRFAAFAAVNFTLMMGLWVVYTFSIKPSELLTGVAAAVLATIGMAVVKGQDFARFAPEVKWLLFFVPLPWTVLKDTGVVFRAAAKYALKRNSEGYLMAVEFDAGGQDPKSSARRALATTLTNIAPNSVLIGIDKKNKVALVHLLSPSDVPEPLRHLGAPS